MMRALLVSEKNIKRLVFTGVSGLALLAVAGCSSTKTEDTGLLGPRQVVPPPYKEPAAVAASTAPATEPIIVPEGAAETAAVKGKEGSAKAFSLPPKVESKPITYTVKAGDSLSKIAWKYGVSYAELAAFNKLGEKKVIKPGQALHIPPGGKLTNKPMPKAKHMAAATHHKKAAGKPHGKQAEGKGESAAPATAGGEGKYTVKSGDSLDKIAKKLHVKAADLQAANPEAKSEKLQIGQKLNIPGKAGEAAATAEAAAPTAPAGEAAAVPAAAVVPAGEAAAAPGAAPAGIPAAPVAAPTGTDATAAAPAAPAAANTLDHTVLTGETLESIAEMYSTTADAIVKINPAIKGNADLKPNMTIQIPLTK
ncbi:MAG: LysM domain-containing protein [Lentisphaeria bacterium]